MYTRSVLKQGDIGIGVNKHQAYLNMFQQRGFIQTRNLQDGVYGPRTIQAVKEFQRYSSLSEDGVIGNATWDAIVNKIRELGIITNIPVADNNFFLSSGVTGISVFKMQEYLNEIAAENQCLRPVPVDGMYGPRTTTAVQMFQYLYDLNIDGVIGKATWDAIVNERNRITKSTQM
ncbi:MAG: peptidoglycan-binding protein [Erysipelotrichaceae bacterium]|nr:peptidoglycan-binding protein [Erysipelotrichaceae bacterium]